MTTFANQSKNTASWANAAKTATTFVNESMSLVYEKLLMESGDAILMESGGAIALETGAVKTSWANTVKN